MVARKAKVTKKKILIVDDHPIIRSGLTQLIEQEADLTVCGQVEDVAGAIEAIDKLGPDVALVDISLKDSNGIELIKDIKARWPKVTVLVLSMHEESFYAERVLRAGAKGYVTKAEASGARYGRVDAALDRWERIEHEGLSRAATIRVLAHRRTGPAIVNVDRLLKSRVADQASVVFNFAVASNAGRQRGAKGADAESGISDPGC